MAGNSLSCTDSVWFLFGEAQETGSTRKIHVNSTPFQVGRRLDLTLSLPCLTVSKLHAELFLEGDLLWVRDLQSMNGTYINGQRVKTETLLEDGDLVQFGNVIYQVGQEAACRDTGTIEADPTDRALVLLQFDKLMSDRAVVAYFQPIVEIADRHRIGFEVLGRSRLFGLNTPQAMFHAASRLNVEAELSRILRTEGIQAAAPLPIQSNLFMNTHPAELNQPGLLESLQEIREFNPQLKMTLEIHEAAITRPTRMNELYAALRDLDIRLAYDDFGAGQSRLLELVEAPPDYLKFDMKLIQGIHAASELRQKMLATLVRMACEAGITPLAEGVECAADSDACQQLGFELGQGFYYGRPALARDFAKSS